MKRYFIYFFFFSLFSFSFLNAQVNEKDLIKMSYDELKLGFNNNENNIVVQKIYSDFFLKKAKKERNDLMLAKGYYMKSLLNDSYKAIKYLDSVIIFSKKINDKKILMIAYSEKAIKFEEENNYKSAIDNYIEAENWAKKRNNLKYFYKTKFSIALIKSEDLGEIKEALQLYRECYVFYKKNKERNLKYYETYLNVNFAIADAHRALNQLDSSTYYNRIGYKESFKLNDERLKGCFILNEGATQCLKGNYEVAIDSIDKAISIMIDEDNKMNQIASYYYYAKSFQGLKQIKNTVKNYEKVDSIYKILNYITPEFVDGYHFLIEHYKKNGDKEKQLYYLNRLMRIDSTFQVNYKELTKKLQKDYDIPHLMQEKETIIKGLHNDKKANYWIIGILGLTVVLSLVVMQHLAKQKKQYKQRFDALMQQSKIDALNEEERKVEEEKPNLDLGIPDDIVTTILKQIVVFENEKQYLKPNLTIGDLATALETNSKYLSIVINAKKEKSFSNYINDLRIDHAVVELKNNKEMRKYTIAAIAEEVGFNTSESFSKAFFKRTGIKPSYFMKELKEV
ncbi:MULTISPECIES: helix-turn-helix domain-containing protein [Flavobacterium]|uniref:Helix-turn-helix domain-containing protein n=1 Tax=Flavobacterium jumunjinense TaxID=998845 RepID=A0ABV5GQ91_9FLAO|nr:MULTISPECIES: AraC family transcriptional regulator [Flavobacterium]